MLILWKHIPRKCHEITVNWIYITIKFAHMSLLLFRNILVSVTLKSCPILLIVQISHDAIFDCFRRWKRTVVAENLMQILKLFQQCRVIWSSFQKKAFLFLLKSGLNDGMVAYHLRRGTFCKRIFSFLLYLYFLIFYDFTPSSMELFCIYILV